MEELHLSQEISFAPSELSERSRAIHEDARSKAATYLVAEADLLQAIMRVDEDGTYKFFDHTFLTPYCVEQLGLSEEVAGTFVRVARKSRQVPALGEAVSQGLSVTKAKTIAAVINEDNQASWIEKAQNLSKARLEREVVKASPLPQKPEKAKAVGEDRHRVEFELNDGNMALQKRAGELVSQKLGRMATLAETQVFLLEAFLNQADPVRKADRSRERSTAVKHAVNRRDRGMCQARKPDGTKCLSALWVHHHHIVSRAQGGKDTLENLITLCSGHHRLWHERSG